MIFAKKHMVGFFCGLLLAGAPAAHADSLGKVSTDDNRYQVYIGGSQATSAAGSSPYSVTRQWGTVQLNEPTAAGASGTGGLRKPGSVGYAGPGGVSYFTPSLSGVRVGIGVSTLAPNDTSLQAPSDEYTSLGPRVRPKPDPTNNWQVGGTLGYSALEIGANIGDHPDPTCKPGERCQTNDFWDVGVALRIGSGSISAAYMASQTRAPRPDEASRIDVFSLNAGYRLAPGVDIYGGVDWVDLNGTGEAAQLPSDTRFMFGTSLRF